MAPTVPPLNESLLRSVRAAPPAALRLPPLSSTPPPNAPYWLHIGIGAFHRAHQALCLQRILHQDKRQPWYIAATSLRNADTPLLAALNAQNNLYTLVQYSGTGAPSCEIIGAHQRIFSAAETPARLSAELADPVCKLVSFTITEGGYYLLEAAAALLLEHPDIAYDITRGNSARPRTVYGFLEQGLSARMRAKAGPITLLSCDNIIGNGKVLNTGLTAFLDARGSKQTLKTWISENVSFPNSMVDRITPVTTPEQSSFIAETFHYEDRAPVQAESFWQWVIEDNFRAARPPLELGGAEFVADVTPYEELKLRLLNAGHVCLAYRGWLRGFSTYDEVIADPKQRHFYDAYQQLEALPQLNHLSALDPPAYLAVATKRFANVQIRDSLTRIGCDGMAKVPKFILPTLRANLKSNGSIRYAVEILCSWAAVVQAHFNGRISGYRDGEMAALKHFMQAGAMDGILLNQQLWGSDVVSDPRYREQATSIFKKYMNQPS